MPKKYKPNKERAQVRYKSMTPFKIDILLFGIFFSLFGVLFLYVFYFLMVDSIRNYPYYNLLFEIVCVMGIMIIADILAFIFASVVDDLIIHKWGYIRNPQKKRNKMFRLTDYSIYTFLRTLCLVFSFVWILSAYFYSELSSPYHRYSFLLAWLLLSLTSRFGAWVITSAIFPT